MKLILLPSGLHLQITKGKLLLINLTCVRFWCISWEKFPCHSTEWAISWTWRVEHLLARGRRGRWQLWGCSSQFWWRRGAGVIWQCASFLIAVFVGFGLIAAIAPTVVRRGIVISMLRTSWNYKIICIIRHIFLFTLKFNVCIKCMCIKVQNCLYFGATMTPITFHYTLVTFVSTAPVKWSQNNTLGLTLWFETIEILSFLSSVFWKSLFPIKIDAKYRKVDWFG